jgi:hypothetical protein
MIDYDKADEILKSFRFAQQRPSTGHACATLGFAIMNVISQIPEEGLEGKCGAVNDLLGFLMDLHVLGWKLEGDKVVLGDPSLPTHKH